MVEMERVNDSHLKHQYDGESAMNIYRTDVINLTIGTPGPDLLKLCGPKMQKATEHRLKEEEKEGQWYLFQYGITAGLWECREQLAKFLSKRYGDPVKREELILTCGASHGLHLMLTSVLSPNGVVFVEEVTYFNALEVFKQFPFIRVVTVPMKDGLVDLDALARMVAEEKKNNFFLNKQKIFWGMFYTIPTYHNPTGMTLPPDSCRRLVQIARKNSILVVCDDVYNLLHYGEGLPPHRLYFYDDPNDSDYKGGNIVSNGSFSKILAPAIRVGWLECNPRLANILRESGIMTSGGAVNHYTSGVIASFLELGFQDQHLNLLVETYRERLTAVCDVLDRYLPRCCSYRRPEGGFFVWIRLPIGYDGEHVIVWCQNSQKVSAIPGVQLSSTGESKNFLRLSIAFHQTEILKAATESFCEGLLSYIRNRIDAAKDIRVPGNKDN